MRRLLVLLLSTVLLALTPAGALAKAAPAPAGTAVDKSFGPLLGALVPDADLVLLLDAKALGQGVLDLLDFVEGAPLLAADPQVFEQWKQARGAMMAAIEGVKATVGADPLHDLDRLVGSVRLFPEGSEQGAQFSLLVTGNLPADLITRLSPDLPRKVVAGIEVSDLGATPDAGPMVAGFLSPQSFLLAPPAVFEQAVASKAAPKAALARHEGLLAKAGAGFLFRLSVALPDWLRAKIAEVPEAAAFPFAAGLARLRVDLDQRLYVELTGATDAAAASAKSLLEAAREGLVGSRAMGRALALLVQSLDLDKLPDVPADARPFLANRATLQATFERFLGTGDAKAPEVVAKGRTVSLAVERLQVLGGLVPLGIAAAVAIPSFEKYKEKAEQAAPAAPVAPADPK